MAEKKKKKEEVEEHENLERWLLTYADMITLLVAFFIMMYSMSVVNLQKFQQAAVSIRSGFGGSVGGDKGVITGERGNVDKSGAIIENPYSTSPLNQPSRKIPRGDEAWDKQLKDKTTLLAYTKQQLATLKLDETIQPILDLDAPEGQRFNVIISDHIVFEPGEAELTDDARDHLAHIGAALKDGALKIAVEGYTAPFHVTDDRFTDSWQLSAERARQVIRFFTQETKINPRRFALIAYGEWKPLGKSRRLVLKPDGEWEQLEDVSEDDDVPDRVVVSVVLK